MKCPECKTKISTKHYDPDFEWYECPGCEGCFTPDEIEEAESGTSPGKRARDARKTTVTSDKPVAKAKKKQAEIAEDLEALAKKEKEWLKPKESADADQTATKHRDEISTRQVVNIMADEIIAYYSELGGQLDDMNAQDKALTLWRQVKIDTGISAREQSVGHVLCAEHS